MCLSGSENRNCVSGFTGSVVAVSVAAPVAANKGGASLKHLGMMQLPPEKVVNLLKDQKMNPSAV